MNVAIVKYNAGNIYSVVNALKRMGIEPLLTDDPEQLSKADRVLFPGQGEAKGAMAYLKARRLDAGKEQPLPTRPSSSRGGGRQPSNTNTICQEGHTRRTPRDTNQAGIESYCLLLEKQNSHPQDNTHCYI